jgi:hypothetical protein
MASTSSGIWGIRLSRIATERRNRLDDMAAISDLGAALVATSPARAAERQFDQDWDWGAYPDQQDACRKADRIAQDCAVRTPSGFAWCDELRLRQARSACSAFSSRIANDRATA